MNACVDRLECRCDGAYDKCVSVYIYIYMCVCVCVSAVFWLFVCRLEAQWIWCQQKNNCICNVMLREKNKCTREFYAWATSRLFVIVVLSSTRSKTRWLLDYSNPSSPRVMENSRKLCGQGGLHQSVDENPTVILLVGHAFILHDISRKSGASVSCWCTTMWGNIKQTNVSWERIQSHRIGKTWLHVTKRFISQRILSSAAVSWGSAIHGELLRHL